MSACACTIHTACVVTTAPYHAVAPPARVPASQQVPLRSSRIARPLQAHQAPSESASTAAPGGRYRCVACRRGGCSVQETMQQLNLLSAMHRMPLSGHAVCVSGVWQYFSGCFQCPEPHLWCPHGMQHAKHAPHWLAISADSGRQLAIAPCGVTRIRKRATTPHCTTTCTCITTHIHSHLQWPFPTHMFPPPPPHSTGCCLG